MPRPRSVAAAVVVAVLAVVAVSCGGATDPQAAPAPTTVEGSDPSSPSAAETPDPRPGSTQAAEPAPLEPAPPPVGPIEWEPCGRIECGTLAVPLDHDDPAGPTIDLAVARRPATDPARKIGTLFVNPGGPGAGGVGFVGVAPFGEAVRERFDIVSWDPRGVGGSAPLACDEPVADYRELDWSPDDPDEQRRLAEGAEAVADVCFGGSALADHLGTEDVVEDLDLLRRAVGDEQLTYVGFSYGTYLGLRYAEAHPERVRALVLDGVVDPTQDVTGFLLGQAEGLERQMDAIFDACERDAECALDDPAATYDRVAAAVETAPLPAGRGRTLGPTALAIATVMASYNAAQWRPYLAALARADAGDGSALRSLADVYWANGSYPVYVGVLCADFPHPVGGDAFAEAAEAAGRAAPRFGEAVTNDLLPCAFVDGPAAAAPAPVRAEGAPPILVVGNTGDVATPVESAERVAADLADGVLLVHEGTGHTSYTQSTCVRAAVDAYLIDGDLPEPGARC